MEADPVEVEVDDVDLGRMSKDLLRIHVRLIMEGVLTMEESKPVFHRAFGALRRLGHDGVSATLSYDCDRLESLLARREGERSRHPLSEAAYSRPGKDRGRLGLRLEQRCLASKGGNVVSPLDPGAGDGSGNDRRGNKGFNSLNLSHFLLQLL